MPTSIAQRINAAPLSSTSCARTTTPTPRLPLTPLQRQSPWTPPLNQGTIKTNIISNSEENLTKLDYLVKEYSNKKEYEDFINQAKNGDISKLNPNNSLAKATSNNNNIKVLPINLKKNLLESVKFESKEVTQELVKIDSLKNIKINETVSNAIFNSPKYFENIAKRLQNDHGIEIKTAKDLSDNFDKIGKPAELRTLLSKTIKKKTVSVYNIILYTADRIYSCSSAGSVGPRCREDKVTPLPYLSMVQYWRKKSRQFGSSEFNTRVRHPSFEGRLLYES